MKKYYVNYDEVSEEERNRFSKSEAEKELTYLIFKEIF